MATEKESGVDLLDLKMLPAWVKDDAGGSRYADYQGGGEDEGARGRRPRDHGDFRSPRPQRGDRRDGPKRNGPPRGRDDKRRDDRQRAPGSRPALPLREREEQRPLPELEIRFLPRGAAFENVAAQIKSGAAAYSVYALARLFLEKPERYDVRVTAKGEGVLFRAGENGPISAHRPTLENGAFRSMRDEFYTSEVTQNEPIKGNFASVARERTTGQILGPTNHHQYQTQLRRLFEQRFSRRMSFPDFQRQIEMVSDPAVVGQWKEDARNVTTYTTAKEETPQTFVTEAEAERHFREKYLPGLIHEVHEAEIDGVTSRTLRDRGIALVIENAWSTEVRSPSNMMQELTGRMRGGGLHIFRHRKGMLFVSPIRPKAIEEASASDSVRAIIDAIRATPRMNRKDLAAKLITTEKTPEEAEKLKLALASDLRWLVREGHLLEFNDGALDLPRVKPPAPEKENVSAESAPTIEPAQQSADIESPAAEIVGHEVPQIASANEPAPEIASPVIAETPAEDPPKSATEADAHSPTTLSEGSTPS